MRTLRRKPSIDAQAPMGEERRDLFPVGFDRSVKLEFRGVHLTADGGLLALRELDGAAGLTQLDGAGRVDTAPWRWKRSTLLGVKSILAQGPCQWWRGEAMQRLVEVHPGDVG